MSSDVFGGNCGMHRALVLPLRACTIPVRMQDPQQRSALQLHLKWDCCGVAVVRATIYTRAGQIMGAANFWLRQGAHV
jgi:hypothetical protein